MEGKKKQDDMELNRYYIILYIEGERDIEEWQKRGYLFARNMPVCKIVEA